MQFTDLIFGSVKRIAVSVIHPCVCTRARMSIICMYEAHDYGTSIVGVEILPIIMKFVGMFVIYNFILITRGMFASIVVSANATVESSSFQRFFEISLFHCVKFSWKSRHHAKRA